MSRALEVKAKRRKKNEKRNIQKGCASERGGTFLESMPRMAKNTLDVIAYAEARPISCERSRPWNNKRKSSSSSSSDDNDIMIITTITIIVTRANQTHKTAPAGKRWRRIVWSAVYIASSRDASKTM